MASRSQYVSDNDISEFDKDGVIVLRGVFSNWVGQLSNGIQQLMANPSPNERSYTPDDGSAPFFQDLCNWQRIESFQDFIFKI